MKALKKEVYIPKNHHITLDFQLPDSIPSGKSEVLLVFQPVTEELETVSKKRILADMFDTPKISLDPEYRFNRTECHER